MWLVGFVTHLPALRPPAALIAILLIAVQAAGAFVAGRIASTTRPPILGAVAGLVTGLINMLIVGSVVASLHEANTLRPGWLAVLLGTLGFSAALGAIGALIGARTLRTDLAANPADTSRWLGRFAMVTVAAAFPVLLSGGLVTSTGTGLAVPDWPTSYNANMFLYPLAKMTGGIYYEHAHRLFGSLIGFTTLILLVFILIAERRAWVKAIGGLAFLFVCGQGILGGIRVTSATTVAETPSPDQLADNTGSLALAAVHGTTAQIFFGLLCAITIILSPWWKRIGQDRDHHDTLLRPFALALVGALCIQLVLGSVTRHFQHSHALLTHIAFAMVVLVLACLTGFRASGKHAGTPPLRILGKALVHTVGLQAALGMATLLAVFPYVKGQPDPAYAVILATAHQATGALLMGTAWALAALALRVTATSDRHATTTLAAT
jgi:cytochrome c oxidase assembly protein subunit 15